MSRSTHHALESALQLRDQSVDGNPHTTLVMPPEWILETWDNVLPELLHDLCQETQKLGGRISGEHGRGHKRKKYLAEMVDPGFIQMLKAIKKALDPNNIRNPGKIIG